LARRLKEKYPNISVIGVEPPPNDAIQGLRCLETYVPPVLDLSLINERAVVTSQQALTAERQLLKKEGIFAGMSSGAAIYQSVKIAREMGEGNIVTILPDGGWKYLSLDFWTKGG
jgi:cysteine synthase B